MVTTTEAACIGNTGRPQPAQLRVHACGSVDGKSSGVSSIGNPCDQSTNSRHVAVQVATAAATIGNHCDQSKGRQRRHVAAQLATATMTSKSGNPCDNGKGRHRRHVAMKLATAWMASKTGHNGDHDRGSMHWQHWMVTAGTAACACVRQWRWQKQRCFQHWQQLRGAAAEDM